MTCCCGLSEVSCLQAFYQRVFATATDAQAQITCYVAAVFCIILAIPSILIGAVAASTDWNQTTFGVPSPYEQGTAGMILPITLQYLCPPFVSLASEKTILVVVKVSVFLVGLIAASLAMTTSSVNLLWVLAADVLYSVMFPQVVCVMFLSEQVNQYGACAGLVVGLLLRLLVGEPSLGIPELLPLPGDQIHEDGHRVHLLPFRTAIMLISILIIVLVS